MSRAAQGSASLNIALHKQVNADFSLRVELEVAPGITILFGASGAGKSTLLDCLAGLVTPDQGKITVQEKMIFDSGSGVSLRPQDRRCGYLFQSLALFPHLPAIKNVMYGLADLPSSQRGHRAREIMESFHVGHLSQRFPDQISGGERQRVALARALVTDPDFLLLDEPLSALDAVTKSRILADLRAWNREHQIPILYVTHDRDEVFALGEKVVVLEHGSVIAKGSPAEVLHEPATETVAQLAGVENVFDVSILARNSEQGTMTCQIEGSTLTLETPLTSGQARKHRLGIRAGDILLATERPQKISARNILPGVVHEIRIGSRFVSVKVQCGVVFEVHVTRGAVENLQLKEQANIWMLVKTHSCHLLAVK